MHCKTSNRTQHTGGHPRLAAGQAAPRHPDRPLLTTGGAARAAPFAVQWPYRTFLELGTLAGAVPSARLHARLVLLEWGLAALSDSIEHLVSDSLNNQHELESLDVAAGQGNRANTQGHVGLVLTSSSEEEAGESFRAGCPHSAALRPRSLPNAVLRSRYSSQSRDSPPRSLSPLTCRNVCSSVNRELVTNGVRASRAMGRDAVRMWLVSDLGRVVVFVWDASPLPPAPAADPGADAESGRGLLLVEALSERWGRFGYDGGGKVVWAVCPWAPS
jgi:hypothetical protein